MARIDEMIAAAREAAINAGGEEKVKAQARAEALLEMKGEGFTKTDAEVGGIVKRKEEEAKSAAKEWQELVGMDYDEARRLFEELEDEEVRKLLLGGKGDDGKPAAELIVEALGSRDAKIGSLETSLSDINRRYARDKVDVAVERAFLDANLDKRFLEPARRLASYDDLIEKITRGEPVTTEEVSAKVDAVKNLSGVWFEAEGGEERDGSLKVAGHKIKAGAGEVVVSPAIPATPDGNGSTEITDEDRAARASTVY